MEHSDFERLSAQISAASSEQILELEDAIGRIVAWQFTEMALARRTRRCCRTRICPHCHGGTVVLHGKDRNQRQRFKCRGCRKTYNIMTGTPMARARKPEKWAKYLGFMTEHMSVRKIVSAGIGVHQVTAWRWRHRFLKAAVNDNGPVVSGVIQAGWTFFLRSFKGNRGWKGGKPPENRAARVRAWRASTPGLSHQLVPVLTALDSSNTVFDAVLSSLRGIDAALDGRIVAGSVLCSDGNTTYVKVANKANAEHYIVHIPATTLYPVGMNPVATTARRPGRLGLDRVNNHHQRLKQFVNGCCRGVATKYLERYLAWNRAMVRSGFEGMALLSLALA